MEATAIREFLRHADTAAGDTAHRGPIAFDRAFVARLAAEIRLMAAIITAIEAQVRAENRQSVGEEVTKGKR